METTTLPPLDMVTLAARIEPLRHRIASMASDALFAESVGPALTCDEAQLLCELFEACGADATIFAAGHARGDEPEDCNGRKLPSTGGARSVYVFCADSLGDEAQYQAIRVARDHFMADACTRHRFAYQDFGCAATFPPAGLTDDEIAAFIAEFVEAGIPIIVETTTAVGQDWTTETVTYGDLTSTSTGGAS